MSEMPGVTSQLVDDTGKPTQTWARFFARLDRILGGKQPLALAPYPKAKLPEAGQFGTHLILVTDDVGGSVPAFSDGTNWRRVTDRAVIS